MRLWDENPCWTTKKSGLQKPLCGCIFLLCSCITLVCFTIYFIGSRSTSTLWLSFLFPTWLQWNLSFGTSLFKRQFHSEDTKFYPRKLLSLYLLPLLKGHLLPGKRDTNFFWVPKTRFNLHSGDTLAPKTWLITKRVDNFKGPCSPKWLCALVFLFWNDSFVKCSVLIGFHFWRALRDDTKNDCQGD